ncbi:MAG: amidohydrolase [Candidatus Aminicenantia bacterium]
MELYKYLFILFLPLLIFSKVKVEKADIVFLNGTIYTLDEKNPIAEALAIKGEKIILVGSNKKVKEKIREGTVVYDLHGKTVIPGFIDAHVHFYSYGASLKELNFVGTKSVNEILEIVKKSIFEYRPGEWITGHGWDHEDWDKKEFPTYKEISEITPDNPVYFTRVDGHAGWANKKAMEIASITKETPDPPGGKIIRDEKGEPTGIFIDSAQNLIEKNIPERSTEWKKDAILRAQDSCLKLGLTEVHEAGTPEDILSIYRELIREGKLKIRIYAMLSGTKHFEKYINRAPIIGEGNGKLTVRALKLFMDGALGSRGAALFEPYNDDPENRGLLLMDEEKLYQITKLALNSGYQVCVHAIGDKANFLTLNAFERAIKETGVKDHRLRIEHAQVLRVEDLDRFAELGVIPSMQPTHATSDMYWAEKRLGPERVKGAYAWKSLMKKGLKIAGGSDFPVENPNPIWGFFAAVTRYDHNRWPEGGWHPEERMTREEALKCFSINAAYSAFEEKVKGTLEPGKIADIVVLSKDIMTVPEMEILKTEVLMTIIGGEIVYSKLLPN